MPAKKRTSEDVEGSSDAKRATKTQKTANGKKGKGAAAKAKASVIPATEFQDKARPLHIHVTHTPPSIEKKDEEKSDGEGDGEASAAQVAGAPRAVTSPEAPIDPGFISNLSLLPSTFSTGSYGWKGSKKITVELQGSEGGEKVQVMLTINATVVGSKQAGKKGDAVEEASEEAEAEVSNEASD